MKILADGRWIGHHGIGRFASEILSRLPGVSLLKSSRSLFLTPLDPFLTATALFKNRPDVFFSPGFNPPVVSPVPFVITIHDLIHLKIPEEGGALRHLYYEILVKPALKKAAIVLTVSEFSRQEILEWVGIPPGKIIVAGNGVSPTFSPEGPKWEPGYPYFLYVGNRKPHKNLATLFKAFSISALPKELRLVLSGPTSPATLTLLRDLRIDGRVMFKGFIDETELPSVYRGAKALLFPSLYEGFGLPVLEAMACGTPVIASRIPAVEEVAGKSAYLVDPSDPDAWKEALETLVGSSELEKTLKTQGPQRSRGMTWEKSSEIVREVLNRAAKKDV